MQIAKAGVVLSIVAIVGVILYYTAGAFQFAHSQVSIKPKTEPTVKAFKGCDVTHNADPQGPAEDSMYVHCQQPEASFSFHTPYALRYKNVNIQNGVSGGDNGVRLFQYGENNFELIIPDKGREKLYELTLAL